LFWKEFNALEIRLNELYSVVDKFIIVEFSQGHSGLHKPFYLKNNLEKYSSFADKIELFSLDLKFKNRGPLYISHQQRKVLDKIIMNLKPKSNDLILTSESDEIVKSDMLKKYKHFNNCNLIFELDMYHNYINNFFGKWIRPRLVSFHNFKGFSYSYRDIYLVSNSKFRRIKWFPLMRVNPFFSASKLDVMLGAWVGFKGKKIPIVENGGWHFTKLYSIEDNYEHAQNTPHLEAVKDGISIMEIALRIKKNLTSYGKIARGDLVKIDDSFPLYIQHNKNKFQKYIADEDLI
jgi:beta-1,4-mannosyl-glycoprotein beta-1,4-N-acetylglucosaminyltransferase